jgi:ABC-type lipoprotein release transport system permease subunit
MTVTQARAEGAETPQGIGFRYRLHMALALIRTNPRSARTFISVALATFLLLISFAAINGMASLMAQAARDVISGDVSVFADGYRYSMLNPRADVVYYLNDADELSSDLRQTDLVATVRPRITAGAQMATADTDTGVLLIGIDFSAEAYELIEGRQPRGAGEVCINPAQRDNLGLAVGDTVALVVAGAPLDSSQVEATVACVYDNEQFGLFRSTHVAMQLTELRRILDLPDAATQLLLTLVPGADAEAASGEFEQRFPGTRFATAEETADLIFVIQTAQRAVMWGIAVATAFICAILVANVVSFALHRARREIATMRTMGFGHASLRAIYTLQVVITGGVTIVIGAVIALIGTWTVGAIGIPLGSGEQLFGGDTLRPWLRASDVAITALLMLGTLYAANVLSTRRLLNRPPIEIIRER